MALLQRRVRLPPTPAGWLDAGERPVSYADAADDTWVVATSWGLWWPFASGPRRIAWHLIDKATWQDGVLSVVEATVIDDLLLVDQSPVEVPLRVPRDLPPTVRRRVQGSVVRSELGAVPGGTARFVGRRVPRRNGVTWWARLEPGTPDTPTARDAVAERLTALRASWESAD